MALIQVNFFSKKLMRTVPINVILPVDKMSTDNKTEKNDFKTLYLLHGILGNYTDWVSNTRIARLAEDFIHSRDYAESCFGNLDEVLNSDKDPQYLIKKLQQSNVEIPKMYIACGTEDPMFNINQSFATFLQDNDVNVKFEVGPGNHNWEFWDEYIEKAINWLPTENSGLGINSGNIGVE